MRLVIVTGISGAGKSTVLNVLEDMGFFCVDNLPPELIPKFIELIFSAGREYNQVALGVDIRSGSGFSTLFNELNSIEAKGYKYDILFLEASDEVIVKRYKETRRKHPLVAEGRIADGITKEREMLIEAKASADYIIDTSSILPRQLKEEVQHIYLEGSAYNSLMITVLSFGFKYGIPSDSDLVFDVRFLPNPYYIKEMKAMTGEQKLVQDYVMKWQETKDFIAKLEDMVGFLIPNYIKEGKTQLIISIGCTGGKHRSVTVANALYQKLKENGNRVISLHRDIYKDKAREKNY